MTEFLVIGLATAIALVLWKARYSYAMYARRYGVRDLSPFVAQRRETVVEEAILPCAAALFFAGLSLKHLHTEQAADSPRSARRDDGIVALWQEFRKDCIGFLIANRAHGIQVIIASILLSLWTPVLVLGVRDLPNQGYWSISYWLNPVTLLFCVPMGFLWPWYRGWRVILAPIAIYLFDFTALRTAAAAAKP